MEKGQRRSLWFLFFVFVFFFVLGSSALFSWCAVRFFEAPGGS